MACQLELMKGSYKPRDIKGLFVGTKRVDRHLRSCLPSEDSNVLIITGSSLAKTPLIKHIESILTPKNHAGTFHDIKQHAPVSGLDQATALASETNKTIDTIISIGGGSPIDAGKIISHRHHAKHSKYLTHIAIPTTLSAAECTAMAGFTAEVGLKQGINDPNVAATSYIIYDTEFSRYTRQTLFMSTGI